MINLEHWRVRHLIDTSGKVGHLGVEPFFSSFSQVSRAFSAKPWEVKKELVS